MSFVLVYGLFSVFFFFKQKTAYEMRISDWSSDVCSSDLIDAAQKTRAIAECGIDRTLWRLDRIITRHSRSAGYTRTHWRAARHPHCARRRHAAGNRCSARHPRSTRRPRRSWCGISLALRHFIANAGKPLIEHALHIGLRDRSEEHTSELQSLMRIS